MATVVVIDEDDQLHNDLAPQLPQHTVLASRGGVPAVRLVRECQPLLALVGLQLADLGATDVVREIYLTCSRTAIVGVSRHADISVMVAAIKHGADDCISWPLDATQVRVALELLTDVRRALLGADDSLPCSEAAARWAGAVCGVLRSPTDVRTIDLWAERTGVASGTLRRWCRAAGQPSRDTLLFARLLRAAVINSLEHLALMNILDVVDRRSLKNLLATALGSRGDADCLASGPAAYLASQRLVASQVALREVRILVERHFEMRKGTPAYRRITALSPVPSSTAVTWLRLQ